jgi:DNA-binding response OmpR family regulator
MIVPHLAAVMPVSNDELVEESVSIVFIEGDPAIAEAYRLKLQLDGYEVVLTPATDEAWGIIEAREPDILYLDIGPARNRDLLFGLRADHRTSRTPVLLLSRYGAAELASRGIRLQPHEYLIIVEDDELIA